MAYDKVVDSSVLDANLTTIANAIRSKTGKSGSLTLEQMVTEIGSIQSGSGSSSDLETGTFVLDVDTKIIEIPVSKKYNNVLVYAESFDVSNYVAYSSVGTFARDGVGMIGFCTNYNNTNIQGGFANPTKYNVQFNNNNVEFTNSYIKFRDQTSGAGTQTYKAGMGYHWMGW